MWLADVPDVIIFSLCLEYQPGRKELLRAVAGSRQEKIGCVILQVYSRNLRPSFPTSLLSMLNMNMGMMMTASDFTPFVAKSNA